MKTSKKPRITDKRILRFRPNNTLKDNDWKFGTWNVLTMLQAGKMNQISNELNSYGISVVALQEIRWKDAGELRKKDFTIYYSGDVKEGHKGTAFYVNKISPRERYCF